MCCEQSVIENQSDGHRIFHKITMLSQGKPRDGAVNFDTIEFYNGIVRFPCTAFLLAFVCRTTPNGSMPKS